MMYAPYPDDFYTWRGDIRSDYYVRVFASEPTVWITIVDEPLPGKTGGAVREFELSYVVLPRA